MLRSDPLKLQLLCYFLQPTLKKKRKKKIKEEKPAIRKKVTSAHKVNQCFEYMTSGNLEAFAALHEVLDVVNDWEIQAKDLEKVHLLLRQVGVGQNFDQVPKVIAAAR